MKVCKRCCKSFDETEVTDQNLARELGDMFLSGFDDGNDLCPECREEQGLINIMGFNP